MDRKIDDWKEMITQLVLNQNKGKAIKMRSIVIEEIVMALGLREKKGCRNPFFNSYQWPSKQHYLCFDPKVLIILQSLKYTFPILIEIKMLKYI